MFVGLRAKENANFTDVKKLESSLRRSLRVGKFSLSGAGAIHPSLPYLLLNILFLSLQKGSMTIIGWGCCSGSRACPPWCCAIIIWWPCKDNTNTSFSKCFLKCNIILYMLRAIHNMIFICVRCFGTSILGSPDSHWRSPQVLHS